MQSLEDHILALGLELTGRLETHLPGFPDTTHSMLLSISHDCRRSGRTDLLRCFTAPGIVGYSWEAATTGRGSQRRRRSYGPGCAGTGRGFRQRSSGSTDRDGHSAPRAQRRELEFHSRQLEARVVLAPTCGGFRALLERIVGDDAHGVGQILPQLMEQEELAMNRDAGPAGNQLPQRAFRQQVGKPRRRALSRRMAALTLLAVCALVDRIPPPERASGAGAGGWRQGGWPLTLRRLPD